LIEASLRGYRHKEQSMTDDARRRAERRQHTSADVAPELYEADPEDHR
jgi:hypothetical protein